MPSRGLGRGFDALIPIDVVEAEFDVTAKPGGKGEGERIEQVPVGSVEPNPHQPRQVFDEAALGQLAESIKHYGIVQPLVGTKLGDGRYQLIAGERRLRAAKLAGLATVPLIVRSFDQQQQLEVALIENLQRADLNPMEIATAYQKLIDQFNLDHEAIGKQVGRDRSTVANTIRLLGLPIEAKRAVAAGELSEGHARVILSLPTHEKQLTLLNAVLKHHWTVRQTEEFARGLKPETGNVTKAKERIAGTNQLTRSLSDYLGAKVTQRSMAKGGRLIIEYYSDEELQRIYDTIKGPDA